MGWIQRRALTSECTSVGADRNLNQATGIH